MQRNANTTRLNHCLREALQLQRDERRAALQTLTSSAAPRPKRLHDTNTHRAAVHAANAQGRNTADRPHSKQHPTGTLGAVAKRRKLASMKTAARRAQQRWRRRSAGGWNSHTQVRGRPPQLGRPQTMPTMAKHATPPPHYQPQPHSSGVSMARSRRSIRKPEMNTSVFLASVYATRRPPNTPTPNEYNARRSRDPHNETEGKPRYMNTTSPATALTRRLRENHKPRRQRGPPIPKTATLPTAARKDSANQTAKRTQKTSHSKTRSPHLGGSAPAPARRPGTHSASAGAAAGLGLGPGLGHAGNRGGPECRL